MESNQNVESKVQTKCGVQNVESSFVKIWNYWLIWSKNIPLSLKMSSAAGGLCSHVSYRVHPRPPTLASPRTPRKLNSVPQTSFFGRKKSLNYTLVWCSSIRHQWLLWVPAGVELRFIGCNSVVLTTYTRIMFLNNMYRKVKTQRLAR